MTAQRVGGIDPPDVCAGWRGRGVSGSMAVLTPRSQAAVFLSPCSTLYLFHPSSPPTFQFLTLHVRPALYSLQSFFTSFMLIPPATVYSFVHLLIPLTVPNVRNWCAMPSWPGGQGGTEISQTQRLSSKSSRISEGDRVINTWLGVWHRVGCCYQFRYFE